MNFGIVDWYDGEKGFGVIKSIEQKQVFIHHSQLADGITTLKETDVVKYEEGFDQRKKRATAKQCEKFKKEYLPKILELLISNNVSYKSLSTLLNKISKIIDQKNDIDILVSNIFTEESINFSSIELINSLTLGDEITKYIQEACKNRVKEIHWFFALNKKKYEALNDLIYGSDQYEIPQELLKQNINSITPQDFKTLSNFSYFRSFLDYYIDLHSETPEWLDSDPCYEIYCYLESSDYNDLFNKLEGKLVSHIQIKLDALTHKYSNITNIQQYQNLKDSFNHLFKYSNKLKDKYFDNVIKNLVTNSLNPNVKLEAYIDSYIDHLTFDDLKEVFKNRKNYNDHSKILIKILETLSTKKQIELIFNTIDLSPAERLHFIVEFISEYENIRTDIVVENLADNSYWENKDSITLIKHTHDYLAKKINEKDKSELLLLGFVNCLEISTLLNAIDQLSDKLWYQCISQYTQEDQFTLLKEKLHQLISLASQQKELNFSGSKYNKIENYYLNKDYVQAFKEFFTHLESLNDEQRYQLDIYTSENLNIDLYINLWKNKYIKQPPTHYITDILKNSKKSHELRKLISDNLLSLKEIQKLALPLLLESKDIDCRSSFYEVFHLAKLILKPELFTTNKGSYDYINLEQNLINSSPLLNLYAWVLGTSLDLDYSVLKKYILFFNHEDQILILKKFFDFKSKGLLNFNISFIYDLFLDDSSRSNILIGESQDLNPEIILCYTVLNELIQTQKMPGLEKIVRSIIEHPFIPKDKPLNLYNLKLLDACQGRTYVSQEKQDFGSITQSSADSFSVTLPFKIYSDGRYIDNEHFEEHKNFLKNNLHGKWNSSEKSWHVSKNFEKELMEFALINKFEVNIDNHPMAKGNHLHTLDVTSSPNNIVFCEGRPMPEHDQRLGIPYWWCAGKACYSSCIKNPEYKEWVNFNLLDFFRIFNLALDELNNVGDHIQQSQFLKFVGIVNRAIGMMDKLQCKDCNHLIFPEHVSHFGASNFVRFTCVNSNCANRETIYLNHCLHSNCKNVIDNRISKKCSNGLYICDQCGTCCSTDMFKRRLEKLEKYSVQNSDEKQYVIKTLKEQIFKNVGHYELVKYYCYKCGDSISNRPIDGKLKCDSCDVIYYVKKIFSFKEYSNRFHN